MKLFINIICYFFGAVAFCLGLGVVIGIYFGILTVSYSLRAYKQAADYC